MIHRGGTVTATPTIKAAGQGDRRWFYGGGTHVWKVSEADSDGSVSCFEDEMTEGKMTPWHCHPDSEEITYLIEGECLVNVDGQEQRVETGGMWFVPRGVSHAFMVLSPVARILAVQIPGTAARFYWNASEPAGDQEGRVDFDRIREVAVATGSTDVQGPPPFAR
jgi:quercetin dioxygenase-like cupin family protein